MSSPPWDTGEDRGAAARPGNGATDERLRSVLDLTKSFVFLVDIDGDDAVQIEWVSESFTRDLGYLPQELTGPLGPLQMVHPEDLEQAVAMIDAVRRGGPPIAELRVVRRDGTVRWIRFLYRTEHGPIEPSRMRVFGVGQDVTEEMEARVAAEASTNRLRAIINHSPFGHVVVSADETLLAVNPAFCELTGYSEEELVGQRPALVVDASILEHAKGRFRRLLASGAERVEYDSLWHTKDGQPIEVELTSIPERDADGRITQFISAVQDVTERNRTYGELSRLAAIVESSDDAILGKTLEGIVTSWNPGAERLYGYTKDEMIGARVDTIIPPERIGELASVLERVAAGHSVAPFETTRVRKDGVTIDVLLAVSPIRNGAGVVTGASAIARDITESKRVAAERQLLSDRLVEAHAKERIRVARDLHDGLGQLLTSASLYASSIEKEAPAALAERLAALRAQIDESLRATRTLVWRLRPVEVEELGIARSLESLAEKIRQRHAVQVSVHTSGLGEALAGPVEVAVYRVVQEAVTNAVRHAAPETISIVVVRRRATVTAVVEDDGKGFDVETTVVTGVEQSGVGIVGMHERAASVGGRLVVESRPGKGTMVRLEAPTEMAGND